MGPMTISFGAKRAPRPRATRLTYVWSRKTGTLHPFANTAHEPSSALLGGFQLSDGRPPSQEQNPSILRTRLPTASNAFRGARAQG